MPVIFTIGAMACGLVALYTGNTLAIVGTITMLFGSYVSVAMEDCTHR